MSNNEPAYFLAEIDGDPHSHAAVSGSRATLCNEPVSFPKGGSGAPDCHECCDVMLVPCGACGMLNTVTDSHVYGRAFFCKSHPAVEVQRQEP